MNYFDHLLAFLFSIVVPFYVVRSFPRLLRELQSGHGTRARWYRLTMLRQWIAFALVFGLWIGSGRPFSQLGLAWPTGWQQALSLFIAGAAVLFFTRQLLAVSRRPTSRAKIRNQLGGSAVAAIIPHNQAEERLFIALAVTAGICEEVIYRGFLLWYFQNLVGMVLAVALALILFALPHLYQGPVNLVKCGVAGTLSMAFYLATGSLLAPIIFHAAADIGGGLTASVALREAEPAPTPA